MNFSKAQERIELWQSVMEWCLVSIFVVVVVGGCCFRCCI